MAYEVTIGIPVFNMEKYIRQTMAAALAQTFQSIEFLICDDCGTDTSIAVLEELQQTHPRGKDIRIVHQPYNMGLGEGRNRIIREAQGRYLYWLDADDIITANCIQLLYDAAQKHDAEIVYGSYERIFLKENNRSEQYPYPYMVFTEPDAYAEYVYRNPIQVMQWNALIDVDILRRNHLKVAPVGCGYGEDFTFTVDLPTYITRAVLLPDITYQYLQIDMAEKIALKKRQRKLNRRYLDASIEAIDQKKRRTELSGKSYFAERCATLLMYDLSFVYEILDQRGEPEPRYTNSEIRHIMWQPMSLAEILRSRRLVFYNLVAWIISMLPSSLAVLVLKLSKLVQRR